MEIDKGQIEQWIQKFYAPATDQDIPEWWNYTTGTTDTRQPKTDEIARQYIPQDGASQGMYQVDRSMGLSILEAMRDTLRAGVE